MKRFFSFVGSWLVGVVFVAVVILIIIYGGKVAEWLEPWVQLLSGLSLLIVVPISLLLLIIRKTRAYGGLGLYWASWPVGLAVWIGSVLYVLNISIGWTIIGIFLGGLGIVPIAGIMTLIRRDWSSFGSLILSVVIVFALRGLGLWIMRRAEVSNPVIE